MSKLKLRTIADDEVTELIYDCHFENDTYYLTDDRSVITIINKNDFVLLQRSGDVRQEIKFVLDELTNSFFETKEGILFEFQIKTNKLFINSDGFLIKYDLYQDYNHISSHKIMGKIVK